MWELMNFTDEPQGEEKQMALFIQQGMVPRLFRILPCRRDRNHSVVPLYLNQRIRNTESVGSLS